MYTYANKVLSNFVTVYRKSGCLHCCHIDSNDILIYYNSQFYQCDNLQCLHTTYQVNITLVLNIYKYLHKYIFQNSNCIHNMYSVHIFLEYIFVYSL